MAYKLKMETYKIFGLFVIFGVLALNSLVCQSYGLERNAGCEKGQYVTYTVSGNWPWMPYKNMSQTKIIVKNTSNEIVWVRQRIWWKNGSTNSKKWPINLTDPISFYVIAGGLEVGDKITLTPPRRINKTINKTYAGRKYTVNSYSSVKTSGFRFEHLFWEKNTGFMLEEHMWWGNKTMGLVAVDTSLEKGELPKKEKQGIKPWIWATWIGLSLVIVIEAGVISYLYKMKG